MPNDPMVPAALWVVFTLIAATAQTFRNAAQKALSAELGTLGATYIRFLFGLPFGLLALAFVSLIGSELPRSNVSSLLWTVFGAVSQIAGTALMLAAMRQRSFLVTILYAHRASANRVVCPDFSWREDNSAARRGHSDCNRRRACAVMAIARRR